MGNKLVFSEECGKLILNKENLLKFYEMKKKIIKEMLDKTDIEEDYKKFNNQLNFIESLISDLDYFA